MKHFTKQNRSLCNLNGKKGIQINNTVYTSKEKNMLGRLKDTVNNRLWYTSILLSKFSKYEVVSYIFSHI